jgi:hypothetical protein
MSCLKNWRGVFTLRYELTKHILGLISVCNGLKPYRKIRARGVPLYVRTWRATRLQDTCTCLHNSSFALCYGLRDPTGINGRWEASIQPWFLGPFAKFLKATVIFMCVYLSTRSCTRPFAWNNSETTRGIFTRFNIFRKPIENVQIG